MIENILILMFGCSLLALMFLIQNAFSKPVYNKMSNVWEDDPVGRKFHNAVIITMVIVAFIMGLIL